MERETIEHLNFLLKTYDGLIGLITRTKNRLHALNPDADPCHQDEIKAISSIKDKVARKITKELRFWPIWTEWMEKIPGVGPYVAGNLILLYYYRFTPVCQDCGTPVEKKEGTFWCPACDKSVKGDGLSQYKIEDKDFPCVSAWWSYMGRGNGVQKRKKGVQANWSSRGRAVIYQFGDQVNRQKDTPYKLFFLARKKKREQTHPDASKGHRHNMARNEVGKLFLSHFWHVAREIAGKSTAGPYADVVLKHTGIIAPYYWEEPVEK